MSILQQRQVVVEAGEPGTVGRRWTDLRVSFDVQMDRTSAPNEATLQVYGLSDESVARFQKPDAVVRLKAGYDTPRLLIQGNPVTGGVKLTQEGTERVLEVELQDGGWALKSTRINLTYRNSVSFREIARQTASQMGLPLSVFRLAQPGTATLTQGGTFVGRASEILDRVAAATDTDWSIQAGALRFVPRGEDSGKQAVRLSVENRTIIGSPTQKDKGIEVKALLEPALRPTDRFVVQSRDVSGVYRARDVQFVGDSGWERDFYTIVTARPA